MMNRPTWRPAIVWLSVLALLVLHHDFWQWNSIEPLLLGWAPVVLWYHVIYSIVCIAVVYLLGRWVWPEPPDFDSLSAVADGAGTPKAAAAKNPAGSRP